MKIYLHPDYKNHKKLEKSILEEFPEISVKTAEYKGGKKKPTFVYRETCYKFENRDDLLLTLKELLEYTERKARPEDGPAAKKKDSGSGKSDPKDKKDRKKGDPVRSDRKDASIEVASSHGRDVLRVQPEDSDTRVQTLREILKSKDYEQIDEAFYGGTAGTDREEEEDTDQTGSYDDSLPISVEKEDHEVMSDTFEEAENHKPLTYEVKENEEVDASDIMEEMGYIDRGEESSADPGQKSYEESIPVSEGKDDVEILEDAYEDIERFRTSTSGAVETEDRTEGRVQPDDLMRELGYVESEDDRAQKGQRKETGDARPASKEAGSAGVRGPQTPKVQETREIILELPVEKYNLNDLNIKIKFGHYDEPSSTYETRKK